MNNNKKKTKRKKSRNKNNNKKHKRLEFTPAYLQTFLKSELFYCFTIEQFLICFFTFKFSLTSLLFSY